MDKKIHTFIFIAFLLVVALATISNTEGIFVPIHWAVFALVIATCYYFRYVIERRVFDNPRACAVPSSAPYEGDRLIYQFHRYFLWIAFVLVVVYLATSAIALPGLLSSTDLNILQKTTGFLEFFVGAI